MITAIREVRKAKRLTLAEVGLLGTRTVSVGWLNRIAKALEVEASDLVKTPAQNGLPVAAILGSDGANAPRYKQNIIPPRASEGGVSILVDCSIGDYRAGDEIWCDRIEPVDFAKALNRDVLVPRPAGRFIFGRLIGREGNRLQVLPPGAGGKQQIVEDPAWLGVAVRLVRGI
jgi:hypothetical protein